MSSYNTAMTNEDHVSIILAQWAAERPDIDASPMGIVGFLLLITAHKR